MDKGEHQIALSAPCHAKHEDKDNHSMIMEEGDDHNNDHDHDNGSTNTCDDEEDNDSSSTTNGSTFSSSDMVDDASSSSCSCSSSSSSSSSNSKNSPLFELSELMAHLPIKRGLSKYYQGKSQSFTSLSRVTSIEDLAKKETPYRRKMKSSKSYGHGLDAHKPYTLPKAIISKKASRGSFVMSPGCFPNISSSSSRPPPVPVHKIKF